MRMIAVMMALIAAGGAQAGGYGVPVEEPGVVVVTDPGPGGEQVHDTGDRAVVGSVAGPAGTSTGGGLTGALTGSVTEDGNPPPEPEPEELPLPDTAPPQDASLPEASPGRPAPPVVMPSPVRSAGSSDDREPSRNSPQPVAGARAVMIVKPGGKGAQVHTAPSPEAPLLGVIPPDVAVRTETSDQPGWIAVVLKGGTLGYVTTAALTAP